jgi:class 3 adenylate cyclase/tetratricopeptide (TPR) repeat protein
VICRRCGEENPARARFCLNCGAPLATGDAEERKLVTILFCDLVGFTQRSDRADPEDVHATLLAFHGPIKEVIELYGGSVDKFIGDAVLGVFGAPVAHEDDPLRAVLAALAIQEAMTARAAAAGERDLAVRIGIDTGEVVVTLGHGPQVGESLAGDVVMSASRLQELAPVNGTAVGGSTYAATRHVVAFEPLPRVGGRTMWRPVEAQARTGLDTRGPATPFVGRADELAQLRAIFHRVREAGRSGGGEALRFVTISGEPGIGKTRLISMFGRYVEELPDLVRWRAGRCLPYGEGVSFWALGEVVKAEAGILDDDDEARAAERLEASLSTTIPDAGERGWLRPRLLSLLGLGEPGREVAREDMFAAWTRFLRALAHDTPFVLVFEDLHWADDAFLDFVDTLVAEAADAPILVIGATRPELLERRPAWTRGRARATHLVVPPLTDGETAGLIGGLLDRTVLPSATQAALIDRSAGNPLYAEEFVRMLDDRGLIGAAAPGRADLTVPETLQSLIGARLDAVPPALKSLLHDAAVVGRAFWPDAVARVSGMPPEEIATLLALAERRELVRRVPRSSVSDQPEYTFWHALIRDVAYGQIPRAARAQKHLAVARWLAGGARASALSEEVAHHYVEALSLASSAGPPAGDDLRAEAVEAFLVAGARARNLSASRAGAWFARALELMPVSHPRRAWASLSAGEVASGAGRFAEAEQLYLASLVAYRAMGDMAGLGEAMGMLSRHHSQTGNTARSTELMDEAIEILEAEPPGPELARVYGRLAGERLVAEDFAGCLEVAERARALAVELGLDDERVQALQYRGAARCELGDDGGLDDLREAIDLGERLGLGEETALAAGNLAYQLWSREGPAVALRLWRRSETIAASRGLTARAQWARMGQLETLFDLGEWDRVLALCDEMRAWDLPQERRSQVGVYAGLFRGWVELRRGDTGGLDGRVEALLADARRIAYAEYVAPASMLALEVRRGRGDVDGASTALREFLDITESAPAFRYSLLPVVVRALVAMDRSADAEALMPGAATNTRRQRLSFLTARAVLDEAQGEVGAAATAYAEAAAGWHEYGFVLEDGLTHDGLARCLHALGRDAEAEDARGRAMAALEVLGARIDRAGLRPA